ncbi:MAG: flagellar biosynthesis repressor FlbT [Caulobacterales bacterium]|nr:flagellar biosynthesis repressor FlbT [Caulobacterales bacterium]
MPLKLSLKPGEKVVVNGAVIQNGERRSTLVLQNRAYVLREKDIMQADDASTPARRIYFPIMMMYLDQGRDGPYYDQFVMRMTEFMGAVRNPEILARCVDISRDVMAGDFYKALNSCRSLINYEEERLAGVPAGVSESGGAR